MSSRLCAISGSRKRVVRSARKPRNCTKYVVHRLPDLPIKESFLNISMRSYVAPEALLTVGRRDGRAW